MPNFVGRLIRPGRRNTKMKTSGLQMRGLMEAQLDIYKKYII